MTHPTYQWRPPAEGWTEEDLLELPDDGSRYEIVDGSLHVSPTAELWHHVVADEILMVLRAAALPGWRPIRSIGVRVPGGRLVPDVTVLRPGAAMDQMFSDPGEVALVVEVESRWSRHGDRFTKPPLYAEAGIEAFWRIERTEHGPVAHLYNRTSASHYLLHRSVNPGDSVVAELPYEVIVAPATWVV